MEKFADVFKEVVEQDKTPIDEFWDNLEQATDVEPIEKAKQEIAAFWDNLISDDDLSNEVNDKVEEIEKLRQEYIDNLKDNSEYTVTTDVEPIEKVKQEKEIAAFWDNLISDDDLSNEINDKAEEIEKLRQEYIDDLKDNSEYPETIEDSDKPYEKQTPEEIAEKRAEFNAIKEKLIKEWEEKNGREWPRYKEDVYVNGQLIRKAGDRYDAHHIHPISFGGKNEASNITPISAEKHFDKQGIHAPESPYGKLEKVLQEVKQQ